MASKRIEISITGKNNARNALNQASQDIKKIAQTTRATSSSLSMKTGFNKIQNEARTAVSNIRKQFEGLGGIISSIFAGASLTAMIQQAGQAESKWNRIGAATGLVGKNLQDLKKQVFEIAQYYGVANSDLSSIYETQLRITGDQGLSLQRVKGIAAANKRTGTDMLTISDAITSADFGRDRALKKQVLTKEQLLKYDADGLITNEELNQILQEDVDFVAQHGDLVKDSDSRYQAMLNSVGKITTLIGSAMLPYVNALAGGIESAANWFNSLDGTSKQIVGTIGGMGLALVSLGAPAAILVKLFSPLGGMIGSAVTKMWELATASKAAAINTPKGVTTPGGASAVTPAASTGSAVATGATIVAGAASIGLLGQGMDYVTQKTQEWMLSLANAPGVLGDIQRIGIKAYGDIGKFGFKLATGNMGNFKDIQASAMHAFNYIKRGGQVLTSYLRSAWNSTTSSMGGMANTLRSIVNSAWNSILNVGRNAFSGISAAWNTAVSIISSGANAAYSVVANAFNSIYSAISNALNNGLNAISNFVNSANSALSSISNPISNAINWGTSIFTGGGPGAARGPRGPENFGYNYLSYAGHKEGYPKIVNGCLTGNCVDLSLGMASMYGGGIAFGRWFDGGNHAWYVDPSGRAFDPTNKAKYNTWNIPPQTRGPGGYGTINIEFSGPINGIKDLEKSVRGIMDRYTGEVLGF